MDFRLRAFLAVAKHLNFTRASRELGVSQPAITKHIQELENIYGVQLFERSSGRISLTINGGILQEYAERIVLEHELLRMEMELAKSNASGNIRIVVDSYVAGVLFHELLPTFAEKYPGIRLGVEISGNDNLETNADIAITYGDDGYAMKNLRVDEPEISPQAQIFIQFLKIHMRRKGLELSI